MHLTTSGPLPHDEALLVAGIDPEGPQGRVIQLRAIDATGGIGRNVELITVGEDDELRSHREATIGSTPDSAILGSVHRSVGIELDALDLAHEVDHPTRFDHRDFI